MELLFIWLQNYRLFNKQGLNFSGQFRFRYDSSTEVLTIKTNSSYLENFFNLNDPPLSKSPVEISNITAIVGENGVGKTSVLDFIKDNLVFKGNGLKEKAIVILQDTQTKKLNIYYHSEIPVKIDNLSNVKLGDPVPYDSENSLKIGEQGEIWLSPLENTTFIFFSNIFDNKPATLKVGQFIDISTNHLAQTENREQHLLTRGLVIHRVGELERQLQFIRHSYDQIDDRISGFPDQISFSVLDLRPDFEERFGYSDELSYENDYDTDSMLTYFVDDELFANISFSEDDPIERFRKKLFHTLVHYFYLDIFDYDFRFSPPKIDFSKLREMDNFDAVLHFFEQYEEEDHTDLIDGIKQLYTTVDHYLRNNPNALLDGERVVFNLHDKNSVDELFELYRTVTQYIDFLDFEWVGISSGQKSLLNIYSRFFYTTKSFVKKYLKGNIVILIDEGEVYLHPQWQKELVKNLIEHIPRVFRDTGVQNIQLIMTSNSPFIISDLPSSNVIFLKRDGHNSRVIDGLEDNRQTFASNIHSLLAHSFFMREGLIGAFAQEKINDIIHLLIESDSNEIRKNKELIEKTINIIGEPLIKNKLLHMLRDKLTVNFISVDERIEALEQEIKRLKGEKI